MAIRATRSARMPRYVANNGGFVGGAYQLSRCANTKSEASRPQAICGNSICSS